MPTRLGIILRIILDAAANHGILLPGGATGPRPYNLPFRPHWAAGSFAETGAFREAPVFYSSRKSSHVRAFNTSENYSENEC